MATSEQVEPEPSIESALQQIVSIEVVTCTVATHGHDTPSHQLARGIVQEMFSGIPAKDAEVIAAAQAEILAAERLKDLCKQLGLAVPTELQPSQRIEVPEYPLPPPPLQFPSRQEEQ